MRLEPKTSMREVPSQRNDSRQNHNGHYISHKTPTEPYTKLARWFGELGLSVLDVIEEVKNNGGLRYAKTARAVDSGFKCGCIYQTAEGPVGIMITTYGWEQIIRVSYNMGIRHFKYPFRKIR